MKSWRSLNSLWEEYGCSLLGSLLVFRILEQG